MHTGLYLGELTSVRLVIYNTYIYCLKKMHIWSLVNICWPNFSGLFVPKLTGYAVSCSNSISLYKLLSVAVINSELAIR